MRYLVIPAHPDDAEFLCSGTVAKLVKEGNEVFYCDVTSGQKGVDSSPKKASVIREKEQLNAAKVLGVKNVIFLREMDGEVENTQRLRKKLVKVVRQIKPDVVITFDPAHTFSHFYRLHRDHRMTAEAVFDAVYPAAGSSTYYPDLIRQGFKPHTIKEAWFFGGENPTDFVDITKTISIKLQALKEHKSQIKDFGEVEKRVKSWAEEVGKKAKMKYAEGFRKLQLWR